ncbi:MAG: glutamate mutase L [Clostridia bacterium]|nr:glutamate mutase L [Clostridia bacterium]MBQ2111306.1 glutamate mutase L [Clostridia bacterium]MBQ2191324.1 glutamate mutase L [Clostridia bacterium]MBQ3939146.1 glutamate mutase L [Clostridia bacterium]
MKPVLLIDFGSTYTKVTAVDVDAPRLLGTANSYTTVQTDINDGLADALNKLEQTTGRLVFCEKYAASSAAGGLRMLASGLVPELTAEAAKTASLGAGAKVLKTYAFKLTEDDADEIKRLNPDIFLLVGGTDGGNTDCITHNAKVLAEIGGSYPVILAGNRNAARECERILEGREVHITENVMPKFGTLNIEPTQKEIREVFLNRIVQAKGMTKASELISGIMMPTPSAVMAAMKLLAEGTKRQNGIGDLVAVDVGGATTDIYSVAEGLPDDPRTSLKGLPEPYIKRTVEGDIGMRYSIHGIVDAAGIEKIAEIAGLPEERTSEIIEMFAANTDMLPNDDETQRVDEALASMAVRTAVTRHAGRLEEVFGIGGLKLVQTGKNLLNVDKFIVTGGSLIHTEHTGRIASYGFYDEEDETSLKPKHAEVLVDRKYIIAAMGLLSEHYPDAALTIMKEELVKDGTCSK